MFSTTSGAARTRVVYTIATSAGLITPEKDPSYSLRLSLRAADGPHVLRRIPVSQSLSKHAVQGAAATCADIAPPPPCPSGTNLYRETLRSKDQLGGRVRRRVVLRSHMPSVSSDVRGNKIKRGTHGYAMPEENRVRNGRPPLGTRCQHLTKAVAAYPPTHARR